MKQPVIDLEEDVIITNSNLLLHLSGQYALGHCSLERLGSQPLSHTAISRKVVGKKVHAKIPKGNMGYDQYTVPDTVAVEPTFVAFL